MSPTRRDFLRLAGKGVGTTAQVLRALDWIATNRLAYNIRVVNMSLGIDTQVNAQLPAVRTALTK